MAGDWIKVEKCSPNKPEVMRVARLWGVPQDQAFGMLVRFWMWLDDASVDGLVDGVASHEIDDMMRFPGFATGLAEVRWLEIDDTKPCIRIPNFGKHNSETSKKRALTNDRQSRWRAKSVDVPVDAKTSTREEKRREDLKSKAMSGSAEKPPNADLESSAGSKIKVNGYSAQASEVLEFLNAKTGKHFRAKPGSLQPIIARLKEGYSVPECRAVIARKVRSWGPDPKMHEYLRPATLFGAEKFAQYVGEVPPPEEVSHAGLS